VLEYAIERKQKGDFLLCVRLYAQQKMRRGERKPMNKRLVDTKGAQPIGAQNDEKRKKIVLHVTK